jgi:hypothetical protein
MIRALAVLASFSLNALDLEANSLLINQALTPANPFVPRAISMVSLDGKTVLTNDGSNYKVAPHDRKISQKWTKYNGEVIIQYNKKIDDYPFKITNKETGESVQAEAIIFHDKVIN